MSITVIKYELVFDENIDGPFLRDKVLSKTLAVMDDIYLQDDDEEELRNEANEQDGVASIIGKQLMQIDEREEDEEKANASIIVKTVSK